MNYEEMSDFEINLAVAKMKYNHPSDPEYFKFYRLNNGNVVQVNAYKMWPQDLDFCNNPSDAWSLLVSLVNCGCTVVVEKDKINGDFLNGKSITRKIAELYLSERAD
jgi:hypothetical protein